GPSIGGTIKAWQSRRLARQAFALIEQRKWSDANAKGRDAFLLRPTEPESWRATARLASRTNQWPAALDWWKKIDDGDRLTVEDRRDYVAAAFVTGEITLATKQVESLLTQRAGPTPIDLVFAGQLAARQSNPALAVDYAQRVLADKRARPNDILAAATLILSVTSPYSELYRNAWHQIEDVARGPKNPASLDALTLLAREEAQPPLPALGNPSLSLASSSISQSTPAPAIPETTVSPAPVAAGKPATPPRNLSPASTLQATPAPQSGDTLSLPLAATPPLAPAGRTMSLTEVADALESHPDARPFHK